VSGKKTSRLKQKAFGTIVPGGLTNLLLLLMSVTDAQTDRWTMSSVKVTNKTSF